VRHAFIPRRIHDVEDKNGWRNAECAGHEEIASAKGTRQVWLLETQYGEGDEFQNQAGAVEDQVDRNELLETEAERRGPGDSADDDGSPGNAALVPKREPRGQHAVLRKDHWQARIGEHQRVEHAQTADGPAQNDRAREQWAAEGASRIGPRAGRELLDGDACVSDCGDGENIGDGDERGAAHHGQRVITARVLHFFSDGRGIVPAHVVPQGDNDGGAEAASGECCCALVPVWAVQQSKNSQDGERRKQNDKQRDRASAYGGRSAEIPEATGSDESQFPNNTARAGCPCRKEFA